MRRRRMVFYSGMIGVIGDAVKNATAKNQAGANGTEATNANGIDHILIQARISSLQAGVLHMWGLLSQTAKLAGMGVYALKQSVF